MQKRKFLQYALKERLLCGWSLPVVVIERMASEYNGFFFPGKQWWGLKKWEKKFGIPFSGPSLVSVDYEKRMIKAVLQKFWRQQDR